MDIHESPGYNPLSGYEIKQAICGSVMRELDKNSDFDSNVAWPVARWHVHIEVEYAANIHTDLNLSIVDAKGGHQATDAEDKPIKTGALESHEYDTSHDGEYPDLTREQLIESPGPSRTAPTSASVSVGLGARSEILTGAQRRGRKGR